jgi:hypothetical protein
VSCQPGLVLAPGRELAEENRRVVSSQTHIHFPGGSAFIGPLRVDNRTISWQVRRESGPLNIISEDWLRHKNSGHPIQVNKPKLMSLKLKFLRIFAAHLILALHCETPL